MQFKQVAVDSLKAYAQNARTHNEKQVAQIAESIKEFGFLAPCLVDKDNVLIVGHGRLMAAKTLGMKKVPTLRIEHLTPNQVKAYRIADNQLALNAGWDMDLLGLDLTELSDAEFDIDLLGFDAKDLDALIGNKEGLTDPEDTLSGNIEGIPAEELNTAWREWAGEAAEQYLILSKGGYSFSGITEAYAKINFLKAKYTKHKYPRHCSIAFHKHQFTTNGESCSALDGLLGVERGDIKAERLRFVCADSPNGTHLYSGSLPFAGSRMPLDFPADLSRSLINKYADGGCVLDPCHGWGGRTVGFLLSSAKEYMGVDVSPEQGKGVSRLVECLLPLADDEKQVNLTVNRFEDAKIEVSKYDLALTSPPYFDVEKYDGGKQSYKEYNSYDLWKDGFYTNLIKKVYKSLKIGGVFALQVGSQRYPLLADGKTIASDTGFEIVTVESAGMHNYQMQTEIDKGEAVLILRKPNKKDAKLEAGETYKEKRDARSD